MRWCNTTHDWASTVDAVHLAEIRKFPTVFAPGGTMHLILEVVAYAADEAGHTSRGRCVVTLHPDGSVSVVDDGRGTDTRCAAEGQPIKKPVMATKDLRFFDLPHSQLLPDGHARRGMSVVAAVSEWLVHTNRRAGGAWTQRYHHGLPVTGLVPVDQGDTTGTTVHFLPDATLRGPAELSAAEFELLTASQHLSVEIIDERNT